MNARFNRTLFRPLALVAVASALLLGQAGAWAQAGAPAGAAHAPKVSPLLGKPLPQLMGPAALSRGLLNLTKMRQEIVFIKDADGQLVKENGRIKTELHSYALVVSFFATYCAPCIREIPTFNKIAASYADRPIRFLYVNCDVEKSADEVKQFALSKGITVEMMFPNPQQTVKQFDIDTLPRIVIADQQGIVREVIFGFHDDLTGQLNEVMNKIVPPGTPATVPSPKSS